MENLSLFHMAEESQEQMELPSSGKLDVVKMEFSGALLSSLRHRHKGGILWRFDPCFHPAVGYNNGSTIGKLLRRLCNRYFPAGVR